MDFESAMREAVALAREAAEAGEVPVGCVITDESGAVIGRGTTVYPTSCVRGFVPEHCVYKGPDRVVAKWKETRKDEKDEK